MTKKTYTKKEVEVGCGIMILLFNLTIGGLAFQYCLYNILGKNIPWYGDLVAGMLLGQFACLGAIICWLLKFWLDVPFIT